MLCLFNNAAKDAKQIHNEIDYRILRAVWSGYVRIKTKAKELSKNNGAITPAWFALFTVENHNGNFKKFTKEEICLLESLTQVQEAYDEVIAELKKHEHDNSLIEHIISTNPDLKHAVPGDYYCNEKIAEYLIQIVEKYQNLLKNFYGKYGNKIESAIEKLEEA